jgi:hypothetical protein
MCPYWKVLVSCVSRLTGARPARCGSRPPLQPPASQVLKMCGCGGGVIVVRASPSYFPGEYNHPSHKWKLHLKTPLGATLAGPPRFRAGDPGCLSTPPLALAAYWGPSEGPKLPGPPVPLRGKPGWSKDPGSRCSGRFLRCRTTGRRNPAGRPGRWPASASRICRGPKQLRRELISLE